MKGIFNTIVVLAVVASPAPLSAASNQLPVPLQSQKAMPAASEQSPAILAAMSRYGKVVSVKPVGVGGLTAWVMEKNGRKVVLYTTSDGTALIHGALWETATGKNVSDKFVPAPSPMPVAAVPLPTAATGAPVAGSAAGVGWMVGKASGPIPESIRTIETLAGVREGQGGPMDTLYIIYDPRCPHCQDAYKLLRQYVKQGFTIKWIPTAALGENEEGLAKAAALLQTGPANMQEYLDKALGQHADIRVKPSPESINHLHRNFAFLLRAFQGNNMGNAGVPAGFFFNKKSGGPHMLTGLDDPNVLVQIFGN